MKKRAGWGYALKLLLCLTALLVLAWDLRPPKQVVQVNNTALINQGGNSYSFPLQPHALERIDSDTSGAPARSKLILLENARPVGPAHVLHQEIREMGRGRYSHWNDAVIFSSSDNSDPRTNKDSYQAVVEVLPSQLLVRVAALTLLILAALALIRRCQSDPFVILNVSRLIFSLCAALALLAAIGASSSRLIPIHLETPIPPSKIAPVNRDNGYFVLVAGLPDIKVCYVPLSRLVAPFVVIPTPLNGLDTVSLEVDWNGTKLSQAADISTFQRSELGVFLDLDKIYGDGLLIRAPEQPPAFERAAVMVRFPVQVTVGGVVILWALFGILLVARWVLGFRGRRPSLALPLTAWAVLTAGIGTLLLGFNLMGQVRSLRGFAPDTPKLIGPLAQPRNAPRTLTPDALLLALKRGAGESKRDYALRINTLVADNTRHIWNYGNSCTMRLHVPVWENYILWFYGEIRDDYRRYTFVDPRKALERGVGMCGQVSLIVTALLREGGLDARVVQLGGHTVVTAEVAPGAWYVLGSQTGVVIPKSLAEIEQNPSCVRPLYLAAFERLGYCSPEQAADMMVSLYGPEGNSIEPPNANLMMGDQWAATEHHAYCLKWVLPFAMFGCAVPVEMLARHVRRRRRD